MEPSRETGEQLGGKLQKELLTKTTEKKKTGLNGYKNCIRHTEVLCYILIRHLMPFLSFSLVIKTNEDLIITAPFSPSLYYHNSEQVH